MAYNTYLTYSAITNNPDVNCNPFSRNGFQSNQASIITGLVITVLSVTWMAFSSASNIYSAVSVHEHQNPAAAEWVADPAKPQAGAPAAYQGAPDDVEANAAGRPKAASAPAQPLPTQEAEAKQEDREQRPWIFHLVMFLASCYVAMMATNWGDPSAQSVPAASPELSLASMWARMGSEFAIHVLFLWTLLAPKCFPNRDFS
jgi:hypothetical protein